VLEQLSLTDAADRLVRTYSGGMRRRLDLGASLVGSPQLLLLDEPTTGLDPRTRGELWEAIRALVVAGTDVVLTTQYLEEADRLADDVVIIDHGLAIASGTPAQLKAKAGRDVVEVSPWGQAAAPAIAAALTAMDPSPQIDRITGTVTITVSGGTTGLIEAATLLDGLGLAVQHMALRQPTLDEVFLKLTGKPATPRDKDADK